MVISIKIATTKKDKGKCFSIRRNVFVKEQNISGAIEFDDENVDATYFIAQYKNCLLYTSPSPRDRPLSRMPSSA